MGMGRVAAAVIIIAAVIVFYPSFISRTANYITDDGEMFREDDNTIQDTSLTNKDEQKTYEENLEAIESSRKAKEDRLSVWRENKPSQQEVLSCIKTNFMDQNDKCGEEATTQRIKDSCNILEFDLTDSDNYGNKYYIYGATDKNIIITEGMGGTGASVFLGKDHKSLGNTIYC